MKRLLCIMFCIVVFVSVWWFNVWYDRKKATAPSWSTNTYEGITNVRWTSFTFLTNDYAPYAVSQSMTQQVYELTQQVYELRQAIHEHFVMDFDERSNTQYCIHLLCQQMIYGSGAYTNPKVAEAMGVTFGSSQTNWLVLVPPNGRTNDTGGVDYHFKIDHFFLSK